MDEHTDLYDLLADDREARDLFRSLPDYIQGAVQQRAGELRAVRRDVRGREQFDKAEAKHPRKWHEQLAQGDGDLAAIA